ncbi:MAG: YfhO family protein [Deltaproteobacteria bacterium]|nr:YfhO family protein [Deltaproteobacteria bacterium]
MNLNGTIKDLLDTGRSRFWILLITLIPIFLLYKILFLGEIIYAPDVLTQYYWEVIDYGKTHFPNPFGDKWRPLINFGQGGLPVPAKAYFPWRLFTYMIFSLPTSIAWETVTHIIFAGMGTFFYCRLIKLNRASSFLAAIFFILSSPVISLINAGHIGKINTIAWAPWVFLALEKGFQDRKLFYFLITGAVLAVQFFEMHWQISFYTCIAVAFYFIARLTNLHLEDKNTKESARLFVYGTVMVVVLFAAISIEFLHIYDWSKRSERAGGMSYDTGMSWSLPPEELVTFLIPGFFGLSMKMGADPSGEHIYYWGRMLFTQTTDYMGIFPLVLAFSALFYRRNWYTKFFLFLSLFTLIAALGKYTPVYRFMFDYLPGFSTFRVPKMILFLFAFTVSVLAGFGAEWLFFDEDRKKSESVKRIIYVLGILLLITLGITLYAYFDKESLIQAYKPELSRSFRTKLPESMIDKRFMNIIQGSIVFLFISGSAMFLCWLSIKKKISGNLLVFIASLLFIIDIWIVNSKFIVTGPAPKIEKSKTIEFLENDKGLYRVATFAGEDSFQYSYFKIPVVSNYLAVSEGFFVEYRNRLSLKGNSLDLMNVKYITLKRSDIKAPLGSTFLDKYTVVFIDNEKGIVLIENKKYLPKAYPVHRVVVETQKDSIFNVLNHPQFNSREMVLLEEKPHTLPPSSIPSSKSDVHITTYNNDEILINADMAQDGFLVLAEKYHPGWKAYINGVKTKIYKANYIARAIYLPEGKHKVTFVFDPWPYKVGLWLSLATFVFLAGAIAMRVRGGKPVVLIQEDAVKKKKKKGKKGKKGRS